jgi:hypothetical protein
MLGILEGLSILCLFTIMVSLVSLPRVLCNIPPGLNPSEEPGPYSVSGSRFS